MNHITLYIYYHCKTIHWRIFWVAISKQRKYSWGCALCVGNGEYVFVACFCTCTEIKDNITEKYCIWDNIEDDTTEGEVIIEEGDCNRQNDEISNEKKKHTDVPVEPGHQKSYSNIENGFAA